MMAVLAATSTKALRFFPLSIKKKHFRLKHIGKLKLNLVTLVYRFFSHKPYKTWPMRFKLSLSLISRYQNILAKPKYQYYEDLKNGIIWMKIGMPIILIWKKLMKCWKTINKTYKLVILAVRDCLNSFRSIDPEVIGKMLWNCFTENNLIPKTCQRV